MVGGVMRKALVVMCGLGVLAAAWATIEDWRFASANARNTGTGLTIRSTSRTELEATIAANRQRVAADPGDGKASVELADALMRAARVNGDASLAVEAERVLRATRRHSPSDYMSRRMLSVVYLSQHRFADALTEALTA